MEVKSLQCNSRVDFLCMWLLSHLWCQGSFVLSVCSLGKWWSVCCVHPGRLCSRPFHSTSLGVDCEPQPDRSDTSACLVVSPQTCSHSHQLWEYWMPSAGKVQYHILCAVIYNMQVVLLQESYTQTADSPWTCSVWLGRCRYNRQLPSPSLVYSMWLGWTTIHTTWLQTG